MVVVLRLVAGGVRAVLGAVTASFRYVLLAVTNRVSSRRIVDPNACVEVSLTSYGYRIRGVYATIESIGRGDTQPRRLVLWLDDADAVAHPPVMLRRLITRGLEIRLCENLGPHKKYYPYCRETRFPNSPLVTADDDVLYPKWWLAGLVKSYSELPRAVSCYRAHVVRATASGRITPYLMWRECHSTAPSLSNFATGTSGVLYPPAMIDELRMAGADFVRLCPRADDVWLYFVARSAGIPIRQVRMMPWTAPARIETWGSGLAWENVVGGGNDEQIAKTSDFFSELVEPALGAAGAVPFGYQ